MIRDRQLLGNGGLSIGYNNPVKMSKTIFIGNILDFSDTPFVDDNLVLSKNDCSL